MAVAVARSGGYRRRCHHDSHERAVRVGVGACACAGSMKQQPQQSGFARPLVASGMNVIHTHTQIRRDAAANPSEVSTYDTLLYVLLYRTTFKRGNSYLRVIAASQLQ